MRVLFKSRHAMKSLKIIATTIIGIAIIFVGVDYFSVTSAYGKQGSGLGL
jgi:preprotein translocase subunit SecE